MLEYKRSVFFILMLLAPVCFADPDSMAELNAKIDKLDGLYKQREIQQILSQLDTIDAQQKKALIPEAPVSSIPVPGQAVAPVPKNYPAPIPGAKTTMPNIFNSPAASNQGTPPAKNAMPDNIYR
jgi:hypothetical protein